MIYVYFYRAVVIIGNVTNNYVGLHYTDQKVYTEAAWLGLVDSIANRAGRSRHEVDVTAFNFLHELPGSVK